MAAPHHQQRNNLASTTIAILEEMAASGGTDPYKRTREMLEKHLRDLRRQQACIDRKAKQLLEKMGAQRQETPHRHHHHHRMLTVEEIMELPIYPKLNDTMQRAKWQAQSGDSVRRVLTERIVNELVASLAPLPNAGVAAAAASTMVVLKSGAVRPINVLMLQPLPHKPEMVDKQQQYFGREEPIERVRARLGWRRPSVSTRTPNTTNSSAPATTRSGRRGIPRWVRPVQPKKNANNLKTPRRR